MKFGLQDPLNIKCTQQIFLQMFVILMTVVISDPHESHGHVHETHGHKTTASHGHGQEEHTHSKVEPTGISFRCSDCFLLVASNVGKIKYIILQIYTQ